MAETKKLRKESCPVSATLQLIGGKYKALLLWHLTSGTLRFHQLRDLVPEATPKMLTQQLRELEGDGLITRTVYPVVPPKVEYALTEQGRSLFPILEAMYLWGSTRMEAEGRSPCCSMAQPRPGDACCGCAGSRSALPGEPQADFPLDKGGEVSYTNHTNDQTND